MSLSMSGSRASLQLDLDLDSQPPTVARVSGEKEAQPAFWHGSPVVSGCDLFPLVHVVLLYVAATPAQHVPGCVLGQANSTPTVALEASPTWSVTSRSQ